MRIAARMRRPGYAECFPDQFITRTESRFASETELAKTVNSKGDWMFYGHALRSKHGLASWCLLEPRVISASLIRKTLNGYPIRWGDKRNADGTAFKWFDIRSSPKDPPLVVARSHMV